jgi:hypothetical protein
MGEMRNTNKILVGNPEGMLPLKRLRHRRVDIIKMDLKEKDMRMWTGFIWFITGTSAEPLNMVINFLIP